MVFQQLSVYMFCLHIFCRQVAKSINRFAKYFGGLLKVQAVRNFTLLYCFYLLNREDISESTNGWVLTRGL